MSLWASKADLNETERILKSSIHNARDTIMEAITSFANRVNTAFDKLGTAVDGVASDVDFLKQQIATLQNSPGTLSVEDQATLDAIQSRAETLSDKVDALDKATEQPPVPTS